MPHDDVTPTTTSPGYQKAPNNIRDNQVKDSDDIRSNSSDDNDTASVDPKSGLPEADLGDGNSETQPVGSPQRDDETSMSGHMPDPESDDRILESAHMMGEGLRDDYENPQELNIARDVEQAERAHQHND